MVVATAPGPDYAIAMLACFFAGAIAVPMPEIIPGRKSPRWDGMLRQLSPAAVLSTGRARDAAVGGSPAPPWIALDDPMPPASAWRPAIISRDSPAFVQFTSGSSGTPKGAVITHGALAANRAMLREACELPPSIHTVTWLPPWHDMGLVGGLLHHLGDGLTVVTIPPLVAVQRPIRWLRAIHKYGATISGGPTSSFRNCIDRTSAADREGLDLRSWKLAFCGAEPIAAAVLHSFADAFAPHGFDPKAFAPCYGLAEATLFATGIRRGDVRVIEADRDRLDRDSVIAQVDGGRPLVSCGFSRGNGRVEIVDPHSGATLPDGQVGEIAISGPHLATGYWDRRQNAGTFEIMADEPRLRTGDLGAMIDGALFVTGRLNSRIIVRGKNYHAEDIEGEAVAAHVLVAGGSALAFATSHGESERTVLVMEIPGQSRGDLPVAEVEASIRSHVLKQCGLRLDEIMLVRPGTLLRTTSGKVERSRCSAGYGAGSWPARTILEPRKAIAS